MSKIIIMDTGFYKVRYDKSLFLKWEYILEENRKIHGRTLKDLKSKVTTLGYEWKITDETLAEQSERYDNPKPEKIEKSNISSKPQNTNNNLPKRKTTPYKKSRARIVQVPKTDIISNTGFKYVILDKLNNEWIYNDGTKQFHRKYLWKLEEDIKNQNLEWTITDLSIAKKFEMEEQNIILSFSIPRFYKFLKDNDILNSNSDKLISIIEDYEKINNGTGILFVLPIVNNTGNNWRYKDFENDSWIYANTLKELEEKIKDENLNWTIIDNQLFEKSVLRDNRLIKELNDEINFQKINTKTGFFRVSFNDSWEYTYSNDENEKFSIQKRTIFQLKEKVLSLNLPWININQELAKKSEIRDKELMVKYQDEKELRKKQEENERITKNQEMKELASEKYEVKRKELYKMFR